MGRTALQAASQAATVGAVRIMVASYFCGSFQLSTPGRLSMGYSRCCAHHGCQLTVCIMLPASRAYHVSSYYQGSCQLNMGRAATAAIGFWRRHLCLGDSGIVKARGKCAAMSSAHRHIGRALVVSGVGISG